MVLGSAPYACTPYAGMIPGSTAPQSAASMALGDQGQAISVVSITIGDAEITISG